jgi:predicted acylesterase/phospholipase RssA
MKSTLALLFASSTYAKECKALAMSGGGAKGSYEAGALWGLYYTDTDKSKYAYDVVTGVSAGGINTAAVSLFAPGDEENMLNFLTEQWQTLTEKQVFTNWKPAGIITGLLDYSGVFDTSPLMNLMDTIFKSFNYELKRKITVSCADVNTGNYVTFDETHPDYAKMIVSTASIPFAFPHQVWDNPDGS